MGILDYFIILLILIWFIAALRYIIWIKKKGGSICCGNCRSCSGECHGYRQKKVGVGSDENTGSSRKLS